MAQKRLNVVQSPDITGTGGIVVTTPDNETFNIDGSGIGGGTDELVKVSAADTTADQLDAKIVVTGGLALNILNPAGNEQLQIDATGIGGSQVTWLSASSVKLSSNPAAFPTGTLIDISTDTGGDTATAAICSLRAALTDSSSPVSDNVRYRAWPDGNSSLAVDVVWVGDSGTTETSATSRAAGFFIVPVDGDEEFRVGYTGSFSSAPTFVLELHGYIV